METVGKLNNGDTCGFGMGLFVESYRGLKHIQHGGATSGYRSYIGRFPDEAFAVVLLGNCSSIDPRGKSLEVADIFLSDHFEDSASDSDSQPQPTVESMAPFTGNYWNQNDQAVTIRLVDEQLWFAIQGGPTIALEAVGESRFELTGIGVSQQVEFRKDDSGGYSLHEIAEGKEIDSYERYEPAQYTASELTSYVGTFYSPELDTTYTVDVENNALVVRHLRFPRNVLVPVVRDVFSNSAWRFSMLAFERDPEGAVCGFRVSSMRCKNVRFQKLSMALTPSLRKSLAWSMLETLNDAALERTQERFQTLKGSSEFYIRESELNDVGYTLLGQNRIRAAILVFKLNAETFPASWNAYDSLGEAYARNGEPRLAIENYEKSIQLNPDNQVGREALKQLKSQRDDR